MKDKGMSNDTGVTNERLAEVAIQNASAQPYEVRAVFAECLAHRVASHWPGSRKPPLQEPTTGSEPKGT